MDKRLILAIALSSLVLLIWSALMPKPVPTKPIVPQPLPQRLVLEQEPPDPTLFNYPQQNIEVVFSESSAAIKEVIFKAYQAYKFPLKHGFFLADKNLVFKKESITSQAATFVYADKDKRIVKRFIVPKPNYSIELEIEIQNLSNLPLEINLPLVLGVLNFSGDPNQARFRDVLVALADKMLHLNPRKEMTFAEVKFLGLRDRYFCAIMEPLSDGCTAFLQKISPQESELGLNLKKPALLPGQQWKQKFLIYLGPQELRLIKSVKPEWQAIMYYGTFDFIAQILLQLLEFIYRIVHNWGWVIVILSIAIYLLLYPLTLRQMRSMKQMQALQPRIEELRKTYKDNPQRLNKEIMELYRQNKVNPLGGCLPLVLQIPVFFALYQVLMRSVALKGANFLWIKDLAEPDRLFTLPVSLPILGNEVNLLPILMCIGMFIQQKTSMAATSSGSAEQQKIMLIVFPLMFGFIFYHMPAGLVLYWFINSTLMLIYQLRISRLK